MSFNINLNQIKDILKGRKITDSEQKGLNDMFSIKVFPKQLINILKEYNIIGQTFSISEDNDPTEMGVEMEWMTPKEQIEEAYSCEPGRSALSEAYLPIGKCLEGTGDPYFFNDFNIFRIQHDAINKGGIIKEKIEYICSLEKLFDFIE